MADASARAIIFDLGGVLVTYDHSAIATAVAALSPSSPTAVWAQIVAVMPQFGRGQMTPRALHRALVGAVGVTRDFDRFAAAFNASLGRDEEALAYARALHASGRRVGVISNTNPLHAAWLRAHLPEFDLFHSVILSSEAGLLKPDPAIYRRALDELGLLPAQAIFVDDTAANVTAVAPLGMAAIHHAAWPQTRRAIEAWLTHGAAPGTGRQAPV